MEVSEIGVLTMEGACSLFLAVLAYKLWRMKISTHSGCCGDKVIIDTHNEGHHEPDGAMNQI